MIGSSALELAEETCSIQKLMSGKAKEVTEIMMGIKEIQEIIPHRHPFLLIDCIEEVTPGEGAVDIKMYIQRAVVCRSFSAGAGHAGRPDRGGAGAGRRGCNFK